MGRPFCVVALNRGKSVSAGTATAFPFYGQCDSVGNTTILFEILLCIF